MSFSYQYGANPPIDYPRLIIADTVDEGHVFEDSEIMAAYNIDAVAFIAPSGGGQYLQLGTPSYRRAAAMLLDSLAANKARLANALKVLDIQVNTQSAAQELRAQAQALRDVEDNSGGFAIVEQADNNFSQRERTWKQFIRLQT